MSKLINLTLGVLFVILGFFTIVIILPNIAREFGGAIISIILILVGGILVISQLGK